MLYYGFLPTVSGIGMRTPAAPVLRRPVLRQGHRADTTRATRPAPRSTRTTGTFRASARTFEPQPPIHFADDLPNSRPVGRRSASLLYTGSHESRRTDGVAADRPWPAPVDAYVMLTMLTLSLYSDLVRQRHTRTRSTRSVERRGRARHVQGHGADPSPPRRARQNWPLMAMAAGSQSIRRRSSGSRGGPAPHHGS